MKQFLQSLPRPLRRAGNLLLIGLAVAVSLLSLQFLYGGTAAPARPGAGTTPTATVAPTVTPAPESSLQLGVAFPRWGADGYAATDQEWTSGVGDLRARTGARWVQMVVQLYQDDLSATTVHAGPWTSSPDDLAAGIALAHQRGLHVFVVPHLLVVHGGGGWGGLVRFSDPNQARVWFEGYWHALAPYVAAAQGAGAEEIAIGAELNGLETAPASLWHQLIARVHGAFSGPIVYNMNYDRLGTRPPAWMRDPLLASIGVSQYQSLVSHPMALSEAQLVAAWRRMILPKLDALSVAVGKPVLVSEVGYRNSTDTLYQPWAHQTSAAPDPALQAAAYAAAAEAVLGDRHLAGVYIWAFSSGPFTPSDAACARLQAVFTSPQALAR